MITMILVESSQIHAYGFDPETQVLALQFKRKGPDGTRIGGSIYTYANVTPAMFDELVCAPSAGTWFGATLKPFADRYPYTKLTDEQIADLIVSGTAPQSPVAAS